MAKLICDNKIKCQHEFIDKDASWLNMPVKFCSKCKQYKFTYEENLQKNIHILGGYKW